MACLGATETVRHIFFSCPHYQCQRKRLMSACANQNIDFTRKLYSQHLKSNTQWNYFLKKTVLSITDKKQQTS
eukprot:UN03512